MIRIVCLVLACGLGGCVAFPRNSPDSGPEPGESLEVENDFQRSRLIALDFVETMVQLPELTPGHTTLMIARPASRFGEILMSVMQNAGYDLRMSREQSANQLAYTITPETALNPQQSGEEVVYTFMISAGSVKLKRAYRVNTDGVTPATSMFLRGSDAGQLTTNALLFESPSLSGSGRSSETTASLATLLHDSDSVIPIVARTDTAPVSLDAGVFVKSVEDGLSVRRQGAAVVDRKNMYVTGRSNYQSILQQFEEVRKDVMVFPDDSLVMGRNNKKLAQQIADAFEPGRDIISVIGCSHGPTALNNGNETLAKGRSWRVKEEFMLAGIDAELVLEEGCWANTHFEKMPARGVLVTHKRRDT